MEKTAIVSPTHLKPQELSGRLSQFVSARAIEKARHLSNTGRHLNLEDRLVSPAHIFAPLDSSYSKVFVPREFPVLYANDFTVCWLGKQLLGMGHGGEIYIEILSDKANLQKSRITLNFLRRRMPGLVADHLGGGWLRLKFYRGLADDIEGLSTVYKAFHDAFNDFYEMWRRLYREQKMQAEIAKEEVVRWYIYSLFGANQKGFLVSNIIHDLMDDEKISGLDLGGGNGFMAAELAEMGHKMHVVDINRHHLNVGRWLLKRCGLRDSVDLFQGRAEDLSFLDKRYDIIGFYGSLLYIDRNTVPRVLRTSMEMLNPGGVLLIQENPKEAGKPGSLHYKLRFEAEQLRDLVRQYAGEMVLYNPFIGKQVPWEKAKHRYIHAVIQKQ